ncbi:onanonoxo-7-onima-8-eninoihtemlysoneda, partial [Calocera cornea HHB12733]
MSLLFRHLRAHAVFGANTDVGKTILTTALCRAIASLDERERVHYLKPVSTGSLAEADDLHVDRYKGTYGERIATKCLFRYDDPVSPHLAAQRKDTDRQTPSDADVVRAITDHLSTCAQDPGWAWVETAGGVLSPSLSGTPQADTYRPLRLPVLLIGDSRLGGIGSTLSAWESLTLRGYEVPMVLLFRDEYYKNWDYLQRWFAKNGKGTSVVPVDSVPERLPEDDADRHSLERYYASLSSPSGELQQVLKQLDVRHQERIDELDTLGERTRQKAWWPFTQHGNVRNVMAIDSAQGDFYATYSPATGLASQDAPIATSPAVESNITNDSLLQPVFDGSASWWTQAVGHSSYPLTLAAAHAAGRYGHVIFPSAAHAPALELAERLLGPSGPGHGWADRVFWSDDGSTAVEVALKMATRSTQLRMSPANGTSVSEGSELGVLGLKGSYHGDTIGAMDASEPSVYSSAVPWYRGRGYWFAPPTVGVKDGRPFITIPPTDDPRKEEQDDETGDADSDSTEETVIEYFDSLHEIYDVPGRLISKLARHYMMEIGAVMAQLRTAGRRCGAVLIEPLLMGAGGMLFVDPLFQRILIDSVRGTDRSLPPDWPYDASTEIDTDVVPPIIFDEVFVGFDRIGVSPSAVLGVKPDIAAYAKILTGGLVPMSVTLASKDIFDIFLGDTTPQALLHGHSYTAHPIGCAVANRTMDLIEDVKQGEDWQAAKGRWTGSGGGGDAIWSLWDQEYVFRISHMPVVQRVMAMGTVLAIDLEVPGSGEYVRIFWRKISESITKVTQRRAAQSFSTSCGRHVDLHFSGIHSRPLGKTVYFMCSLNTPGETLRSIEKVLEKTLS